MTTKCQECRNWFSISDLVLCGGGCGGLFCGKHLKNYKDVDGFNPRLCPGCYMIYDNRSQK